MNYRKSFLVLQIASYTALVLMLVDIFLKLKWLTIIEMALLILASIQAAIFCRCPHCGIHLNTRRFTPEKMSLLPQRVGMIKKVSDHHQTNADKQLYQNFIRDKSLINSE